jgi:heme/copper-type cytochrome/quinol oxidase subunit 2
MAHTTLALHSTARVRRLSPIQVTSVAALVGVSLALAYVIVAVLQDPGTAIIAAVPLLAAATLALRWRWAPPLGALTSLLAAALLVGPEPEELLRLLANPTQPLFAVLILGFASAAVGLIACLAQLRPSTGNPGWLRPLLMLTAGLIVGALAVGSLPHSDASVSGATLTGLPSLTTSGMAFDQPEIHATVGQTIALRLHNSDQLTHYFEIDDLDVHTPMPAGQDAVAVFQPTRPGTYLFYCGPHYDPSTGQGMHGTLVVE